MISKKSFEQTLIDTNTISQEKLREALKTCDKEKKKLFDVLLEYDFVDEEKLAFAIAGYMNLDYVNLSDIYIDIEVIKKISFSVAEKNKFVPIKQEDKKLMIAIQDPTDIYALEDIQISTNLQVIPLVSTYTEIRKAQLRYYGRAKASSVVYTYEPTSDKKKKMSAYGLTSAEVSSQAKFIDYIIDIANNRHASDIHIEPYETFTKIRNRIDGDLVDVMNVELHHHTEIIGRIKILCNMDTAETRLPQDGHFKYKSENNEIDLRISILPTIFGEKAVIRLIYRAGLLFDKNQLGFFSEDLRKINIFLNNPHGVILVVGPTGSGKTTTLATFLRELNKPERNIVTIEDPVEQIIEGITQVEINTKIGLTFSHSLRAILRQDPDIIMIGEMRDKETADIALRSAMTGHLVMSTLHTNDSVSAVIRLYDMGIEHYVIAATLKGVIYQRLFKKICSNCKKPMTINPKDAIRIGLPDDTTVYKGKGCAKCNNTGYSGRIGAFEILSVDEHFQKLISAKSGYEVLYEYAVKSSLITLKSNALINVLQGNTTTSEFFKIFI